jgi:hypothetical protein
MVITVLPVTSFVEHWPVKHSISHRLPDGWEQKVYEPAEAVELKSLGLSVPISQIYEDIPE